MQTPFVLSAVLASYLLAHKLGRAMSAYRRKTDRPRMIAIFINRWHRPFYEIFVASRLFVLACGGRMPR
jgi:hypothetical protein